MLCFCSQPDSTCSIMFCPPLCKTAQPFLRLSVCLPLERLQPSNCFFVDFCIICFFLFRFFVMMQQQVFHVKKKKKETKCCHLKPPIFIFVNCIILVLGFSYISKSVCSTVCKVWSARKAISQLYSLVVMTCYRSRYMISWKAFLPWTLFILWARKRVTEKDFIFFIFKFHQR